MVKRDKVEKTKKGDIVTRFWYTLKNLDLMVVTVVIAIYCYCFGLSFTIVVEE
jgi:hypothetical protein